MSTQAWSHSHHRGLVTYAAALEQAGLVIEPLGEEPFPEPLEKIPLVLAIRARKPA